MPICGMGNIIRREIDMTITFKEGMNPQSVIVKHGILMQAATLITGREGVLETEKELYLMLAMVDFLAKEDIIEACNQDDRDLVVIMAEDIEPKFFELMKDEKWSAAYLDMRRIHLQRCQEIWDNQHSLMGVFDTLLSVISTIDEDDKKTILENTAKVAQRVQEHKTEVIEKQSEKVNSKLEQLVQQYQRASTNQNTAKSNE